MFRYRTMARSVLEELRNRLILSEHCKEYSKGNDIKSPFASNDPFVYIGRNLRVQIGLTSHMGTHERQTFQDDEMVFVESSYE